MERALQTQPLNMEVNYQDAWDMVASQLRMEMSRALYDTWVKPLQPISYQGGTFTLAAFNPYAREWVENRLNSRIIRLLEGLFGRTVDLQIVLSNSFGQDRGHLLPSLGDMPEVSNTQKGKSLKSQQGVDSNGTAALNRKVVLQRAYGSERARIIQPERGMFVTLYFFYEWVPLIGHSAAAAILAARSMCYWNPMTGELRNTIETDMSELARRASVSVRTMKDVLNNEYVQKYFLRYKVRRIMTPNGVRTAGISLQVRMDDPLTPADQQASNLPEDEHWYLPEFGDSESEENE